MRANKETYSVTVFIGGNPARMVWPGATSGFAFVAAEQALSNEATDCIADTADQLKNGSVNLAGAIDTISQMVLLDSTEKIAHVLTFLANELGQSYFEGQ